MMFNLVGIKHRSVDYALNAKQYTRRNMVAAGWRRASPAERSVGIAWVPRASSVASHRYAGLCIMADAPKTMQEMPLVPKAPPSSPLESPEPSEPSYSDFDVASDDPDAPEASSDEQEQPAAEQLLEEVILKVDALKRGRGATRNIGKDRKTYIKRIVKQLTCLGQQHGLSELADVLLALQADRSELRDELIQDFNERDHSKGETSSRQNMEALKLIMEGCCDWSTVCFKDCAAIVSLSNVIAVKTREYGATYKDKRAHHAVTEHQSLFTQGGVVLPKNVLMATEPSWLERAGMHQQLLPQVMRELEDRMQNGLSLKSSGRRDLRLTESDKLLQFKCLFLISESVPCQRKTPWQTMTWTATPPAPFATDGTIDARLLDSLPAYLVHHPDLKLYGLTQWHTKIGMCLWLPLPAGIQSLVKLYLELLEQAYQESPAVRLPEREGEMTLFPSMRGTPRGDTMFRNWEKEGFSAIGLQGASVFNARHALTRHLILQGITPTSQEADLADSFCAAMQTSTKHVFGEKVSRAWGLAPYNMALEASGSRRAEQALKQYSEWLFPARGSGQKRRADAAASLAKKKKKKKK